MAEISASDVKELRERTGAGMMDCKNALAETNGDVEKAVALLRDRGMAAAAKRTLELGCMGLSLGVERTNPALEFYRRLGMEVTDRSAHCRFKSEDLPAFIG